MSDEAALLAAILAHPDEDTPRLMYADWLDEHGQPERAEFIRLQIERGRLTRTDPEFPPLAQREGKLFGRYKKAWSAPLAAVLPDAYIRFVRGFPEDVATTASALLANADAVWRLAPLRYVSVKWAAGALPELSDLARPPGARLIAECRDWSAFDYLHALELLPQAPGAEEGWFRSGRWLVLEWPVGTVIGRRALAEFGNAVRHLGFSKRLFGGWHLAARPVRADHREPTWTILIDGTAVSRQTGGSVPDLRSEFWMPLGSPFAS